MLHATLTLKLMFQMLFRHASAGCPTGEGSSLTTSFASAVTVEMDFKWLHANSSFAGTPLSLAPNYYRLIIKTDPTNTRLPKLSTLSNCVPTQGSVANPFRKQADKEAVPSPSTMLGYRFLSQVPQPQLLLPSVNTPYADP